MSSRLPAGTRRILGSSTTEKGSWPTWTSIGNAGESDLHPRWGQTCSTGKPKPSNARDLEAAAVACEHAFAWPPTRTRPRGCAARSTTATSSRRCRRPPRSRSSRSTGARARAPDGSAGAGEVPTGCAAVARPLRRRAPRRRRGRGSGGARPAHDADRPQRQAGRPGSCSTAARAAVRAGGGGAGAVGGLGAACRPFECSGTSGRRRQCDIGRHPPAALAQTLAQTVSGLYTGVLVRLLRPAAIFFLCALGGAALWLGLRPRCRVRTGRSCGQASGTTSTRGCRAGSRLVTGQMSMARSCSSRSAASSAPNRRTTSRVPTRSGRAAA